MARSMVHGGICVRSETKPGERRVTVVPNDAVHLRELGLNVAVQRDPHRCIPDSDYSSRGIPLVDSTDEFRVIVATKEYSADGGPTQMHAGQILMGFHHVHKGQPYNLVRLRRALDIDASMFDYELYRPDGMTQPVTTSVFAGIAGAANGLGVLGQRRRLARGSSVFTEIEPGWMFNETDVLRRTIESVKPLSEEIRIAVIGTGACGQGATQVCQWLGLPRWDPARVLSQANGPVDRSFYTVFGTPDYVQRIGGGTYDQHNYRKFGRELYEDRFGPYRDKFNLIVFCPYWDDSLPKLLPPEALEELLHLDLVISDVTCDIRGSVACTIHENKTNSPISTYYPKRDISSDGVALDGIVVTAVDNLPSQIALSCSEFMSGELTKILPELVALDPDMPFDALPPHLQTGFITWNGRLAPRTTSFKRFYEGE